MSHTQDGASEEKRYSLYGLMSQLLLNGKVNVTLANHTTQKIPANKGQLQRFTVAPMQKKVWQCSTPFNEKPALGSNNCSPVSWKNIGRYISHNVSSLPNQYMQVAWGVILETQVGQHMIQFERPYLIWNKTISFKKDQYIRMA